MIPDILRHVPRKGENLMFNEKKLDELATRMKEKEISIPTDLAGSILFFLLGTVLFFMLPSQVPISENDVINGRVFPKLLFSLMMICSAVLIIQNIIKISKIGKWHLASDGELEKPPTIDHTITAVPKELRGGYTGFWRAADVLEFTSHGYDGYVFDENNNQIDFKGYRPDCITDLALQFFDQYDRKKPFFMTVSQIEPHHQNDHNHYEGPAGSKEKYKDFVLPGDLAALKGNAAEEYPDYLGQCASLDENLGRLVNRLKEEGLYDNTVIIFASDHGSHFKTRNTDEHLNGYDDYKRSCHDAATHVPLVIAGGAFKGGKEITELVSTESLPKTILAIAGVDVGDAMIGENLLDVVQGKTDNRANEVYSQISESRVGRSIRTEDYMYAVYAPGKNGGEYASADLYADDFLYDLKKDPYELTNLIHDHAYDSVRLKMREKLLAWIEKAEHTRPVIVDQA